MGMISAQIDELRAMAQLKKSLEKPAEARILDDAADTIWQLHDDLQRANAENAKLRELLQRALTSHDKMCTNRGTCAGCLLFEAKPLAPACPIISVMRDACELGVKVGL